MTSRWTSVHSKRAAAAGGRGGHGGGGGGGQGGTLVSASTFACRFARAPLTENNEFTLADNAELVAQVRWWKFQQHQIGLGGAAVDGLSVKFAMRSKEHLHVLSLQLTGVAALNVRRNLECGEHKHVENLPTGEAHLLTMLFGCGQDVANQPPEVDRGVIAIAYSQLLPTGFRLMMRRDAGCHIHSLTLCDNNGDCPSGYCARRMANAFKALCREDVSPARFIVTPTPGRTPFLSASWTVKYNV